MIKIYTDGSCIGNPGNGGWAAIIIENGNKTRIKGSKKDTTNNQMELLAPIKALKKIKNTTIIFTMPNHDIESSIIYSLTLKFVKKKKKEQSDFFDSKPKWARKIHLRYSRRAQRAWTCCMVCKKIH